MSYGEKLFGYACMTTVLVIIFACVVSDHLSSEKIVRMVKDGANPMDAACAIRGYDRECLLAGRN